MYDMRIQEMIFIQILQFYSYLLFPGVSFMMSERGARLLVVDGFKFRRQCDIGIKTRWWCSTHYNRGCRAVVYTVGAQAIRWKNVHNHPLPWDASTPWQFPNLSTQRVALTTSDNPKTESAQPPAPYISKTATASDFWTLWEHAHSTSASLDF